jgi:hypothetical protein
MGRDRYLEATRHVAPCDPQTAPIRRAIGAAIGYVPPKDKPGQDASLLEVSGVTLRVGYWHTCEALHRWFVDNVLEGNDDGRPATVQDDCLRELQRVCERVIDDPGCAATHFTVEDGAGLDREELRYTLEILSHAITLQEQGWDITYRASG